MHKLHIDLEYLVFAWQDESPDAAYYLDSDTGSVLLVQRDLDDLHELREEIELQPARFLYVPKQAADQIELDLSDFIFTVPDTKVKALLEVAYESPTKMASCRTILNQHEDQLDRWQKWRHDATQERVRRWLAANNLEAI